MLKSIFNIQKYNCFKR